MDEIEYKLNTKNSVLIVNAIDKLISAIKSKYKPSERQKFVLDNEELKYLREKCTSKETMVSLTACQGLLALVQLGVLEIGHTMSTVVTLLPSAHNYSAIISTIAGLLILDLKSRLIPGQQYTCQFSLRSPQHPLITVLERVKGTENDVIEQMHALCTHPDYTVSSNSLELLRPVFLWLTCESSRGSGARPWRLLLGLPPSAAQAELLLTAIGCQQTSSALDADRALSAYAAAAEAALARRDLALAQALLPLLARLASQLIAAGRDPRACYVLIERCSALEASELRAAAGLTVSLLAENLVDTAALYLHELFNLCLNIISKHEYSSISLSIFAALSLQWLHLPSYLTSSALKAASKILDIYENEQKEDSRLFVSNLKSNKTFQYLMYTDKHLSIMYKLTEVWERIKDDPVKLNEWLDNLGSVDDFFKLEIMPFLIGLTMERRQEEWYEEIAIKALKIVVKLVDARKEVSVQLMPILLYKIANDKSPNMQLECLRALPLMAKTKENVPTIVSVLTKLKVNKGVPMSFLITLYCSLAETQVRCFPYLQEMLVDPGAGRHDDLKWEADLARALAVDRICEIRPTPHGVELVPVISGLLSAGNACPPAAAALAVRALGRLWARAALAPPKAWRALQPRLARDARVRVQGSICELLALVPGLRVATPEYDWLIGDAARQLWVYVANSNDPEVVEAACAALAAYKVEDYKLKDLPEVYRRTVKLPSAYCKTPADAARKPEDVLDYIPCEVWPEVFKYTNHAALPGVQAFVGRLVEREVKGYRSGVYQPDARTEPPSLGYLPAASVARGLCECVRKQATSPSYDFPETVLLAILNSLTSDWVRPLPPLDLCFLHELFHRGSLWREACGRLAARQAPTSGSARRFLDNYLQAAVGSEEESDATLVFDLLPMLCRGMPPNSLRPALEKYVGEAYMEIAQITTKDCKGESEKEEPDYRFIKQLKVIKECLESEKIHEANRTLLSQIVEGYFPVLSDDNVAWPTYVSVTTAMATKYLERMTSPSGWWEVTSRELRKAGSVRAAAAGAPERLVWLNEYVDAQAKHLTDQEYSLQCILPVLKAADPDDGATVAWFLQLMARTQVAFTETEDENTKLYLCDVFMVSVIAFSGHWALDPDGKVASCRQLRRALLPPAAAALGGRPQWQGCSGQMLEWLCHSGSRGAADGAASVWRRALLACRDVRTDKAPVWKRLESFGKISITDED